MSIDITGQTRNTTEAEKEITSIIKTQEDNITTLAKKKIDNKGIPCRNLRETGHCKYGAKCWYEHEDNRNVIIESNTPSERTPRTTRTHRNRSPIRNTDRNRSPIRNTDRSRSRHRPDNHSRSRNNPSHNRTPREYERQHHRYNRPENNPHRTPHRNPYRDF